MKKFMLFTLSFLLFSVLTIKAQQQAPNSDFETWTDDNNPASWSSSNISVPPFVDYKVIFKESTDPHSGSYCAKLYTQEFTAMSITRVVPAFITLGKFWFTVVPQAGGYKGGIPFIARPDSVKFFYKADIQGTDKAMIAVETWKGFHTQLIAGDTTFITTSTTSWTPLVAALNYHDVASPDSLNIVLSASNLYDEPNITKNTTMYVDDLTLIYNNVSVIDLNYSEHFYVYAAENQLVISMAFANQTNTRIAIYSVNGQLVYDNYRAITESQEKVSLDRLGKGVYIVDVTTDDGQRYSQKIAVR